MYRTDLIHHFREPPKLDSAHFGEPRVVPLPQQGRLSEPPKLDSARFGEPRVVPLPQQGRLSGRASLAIYKMQSAKCKVQNCTSSVSLRLTPSPTGKAM